MCGRNGEGIIKVLPDGSDGTFGVEVRPCQVSIESFVYNVDILHLR